MTHRQQLPHLGDVHSEVQAPSLLLRNLPSRRPCSFGPSALLPHPGLRLLRRFPCLWPLALPPLGSACRACDLHSPPGLLPPSGSKRSTAFAACRSAWRIRPISFRSPPPVLVKVWAADHR